MSNQENEDQDMRVVALVLISAVVLAVGLAIGMGIQKARGSKAPAPAAAPAAAAPAAPAAVEAPAVAGSAASGDASVVVENGVVKFYFASGKSDLAAGALAALGDAIAAAQAGKRLVISGFHDATGGAALNAELAKQRAFAVRDALLGAGVAESSMDLKKPEETTGSGNPAEARRVEVVIQ